MVSCEYFRVRYNFTNSRFQNVGTEVPTYIEFKYIEVRFLVWLNALILGTTDPI